ncbi:MAG: hypothetical protein DCF22_07420 [Leptolyngbya sp.]|nr:MAG: hypothetical protein DCF22_07420 [Leptolyngbya sp.]
MRLKDSVWQGNFGYWQTGYIHTNLLMIGYLAWSGFLQFGRGFVVCTVDAAAIATSATPLTLSPFTAQFIPAAQLSTALSLASMTGTLSACQPTEIPALQKQANDYDPNRDAMILLIANGRMEASLLHNMAIAPQACYQQVRDRWEEFQPCLMSSQEL